MTQRQVVSEYLASKGTDLETLNSLPDDLFLETYGDSYGVEQVGGEEVALTEARVMSMLGNDVPAIIGLGSHSRVAYSYNSETKELVCFDPMGNSDEPWVLSELMEMGATIVNYLDLS